MNPTLAILRMQFRNWFNALFIKTSNLLHKDLKCNWIEMLVLVMHLNSMLKKISELEALDEPLDHLITLVSHSLLTLYELTVKLENNKKNAADHTMIDRTMKYRELMVNFASKLIELKEIMQTGRISTADIKSQIRELGKVLMTDSRVTEFITESFMEKSFRFLEKNPIFADVSINGKKI